MASGRATVTKSVKKAGAKRVGKASKKGSTRRAKPARAKAAGVEGMSSEAVKKGTGRTWEQWHATLDKHKAMNLSHKEIAILVHEKYGVSEWWAQTVTVGYERARGLRVLHQKVGGFSVSASKTIACEVSRAFEAWTDDRLRTAWLGDAPLTIRKAAADKSLRASWGEKDGGSTLVVVNFYAKGPGKCQVAVQHEKLPDAKAAAACKAYWGEQVEALKAFLEK